MQDFSNNKLIKFLDSNEYHENGGFLCLGLINKFKFFVIKILMSLPIFLLKKLSQLWNFVYLNQTFFTIILFIKFLKNNDIKSVTIEDSLKSKVKNLIGTACNLSKIKLISVPSGLFTVKKKEKIDIKYFDKLDLYLVPNLLAPYKEYILKSSKFHLIGSARYDKKWLEILKNIFINDKILKKKDKIRIAYFIRSTTYNIKDQLYLIKEIEKINDIEIKLGNKPREIVPLKVSLFGKDEFNTTQLILWSDIVISSATSVLVESIQREKLTICLEYLFPERENFASHFSSFPKIVKIANSSNETIKYIKDYINKGKKYEFLENELNEFYKSFINQKNKDHDLLENFVNIYSNL